MRLLWFILVELGFTLFGLGALGFCFVWVIFNLVGSLNGVVGTCA